MLLTVFYVSAGGPNDPVAKHNGGAIKQQIVCREIDHYGVYLCDIIYLMIDLNG